MQTSSASRRRLAGVVATAVLLLTLGSGGASAATSVVLTPVVSGLNEPDYVIGPNDGTGRLFVVEQPGRIMIVKNGAVLPTPFLDISDLVSNGGEQGLLGLAFHPKFASNGLFYVDYTSTAGDTEIVQFGTSPTNRDLAVRSSMKPVLQIGQPFANHNGGMLAFGPDNYLYIGMGDGGSAGDPGNRAQNKGTLLGKILRINVNGSTGAKHYRIPASNPYVGKAGLDEIWSIGLRNPWRFSFDRLTGDLWIGDVGQDRFEEIDRATVSGTAGGRGLNFGWRQMEGRHCYDPATGCNTTGKFWPVVEYSHSEGCSVTGGYVYRGSAVPSLAGRYVFGDFCSGTIWTVPKGGTSPMTKSLLMHTSYSISSFGQDAAGELYVVDRGGAIYRFDHS